MRSNVKNVKKPSKDCYEDGEQMTRVRPLSKRRARPLPALANEHVADQLLAEKLLQRFGRARNGHETWETVTDRKRGRFIREARLLRVFLRQQRELGLVEEW